MLNLMFSAFELFGGILTGSVAILSDALHDTFDAIGIGASYFLEHKSKQPPNDRYTYGYARLSVLGSVIVTLLLAVGSVLMIYHSVCRLFAPTQINYDGMIIFALVGVIINAGAAFFTHGGHSLNQKAVNLHMLEDVMGWLLVLIGAIVMRFSKLSVIDPMLSVCVAGFILFSAVKNLKEALDIFLEKVPHGIDLATLKEQILQVDGVLDVHHIHVWSLNGETNFATMHLVTSGECPTSRVREILEELGISHVTIEFETAHCGEEHCHIATTDSKCHHH